MDILSTLVVNEGEYDDEDIKQEYVSEGETAEEGEGGEEGEGENLGEEEESEEEKPRKRRRRRKKAETGEDDAADEDLIFCCFVCSKKFRTERGLAKHLQSHSEEKVNDYCCHECGKVFSTKSGLSVHFKQHSSRRTPVRMTRLNCPICDKMLTSKLGLQIHIQRHSAMKQEISTKQAAVFVPVDEGEETGEGEKFSVHVDEEMIDYHCLVCGRDHDCKEDLVEHMKVHDNRLKFECPICQKKLSTKGALNVHLRIHMEGDKQHECPQCGKRFRAKGNMLEHQRTHRENRSFGCSYCDKSFKQRSNLTVHLLLAHGESATKRMVSNGSSGNKSGELDAYMITTDGTNGEKLVMFRCPMCNKTLASKRGLSIHMQLHIADSELSARDVTGVEGEGGEMKTLFECYVCFKLLASRAGLDKHLLTHSDDNKPLACTRCDKKFRDARSLMAHESIHTGEKPFYCSYCEKKYAQRSNLITHLLLAHGVRTTKGNRSITVATLLPRSGASNFVLPPPIVSEGSGSHLCSICAKQFVSGAALAAHERVHTEVDQSDEIAELLSDENSVTYCQCSSCNATFPSLSAFNDHTCTVLPDDSQTMYDSGIQLIHMCAVCGDQFDNESLLANHTCTSVAAAVECATCGKQFDNKVMLTLHTCETTGDDSVSLSCPVCDIVCTTNDELQSHLRTHVGADAGAVPLDGSGDAVAADDLTCWPCSIRFSTAEELAAHTAEGLCGREEATLMCEACGASFDSEPAARRHVEVEHGGAQATVATVTEGMYVYAGDG